MPKNPNTPEKYRVRRARLVEALRDGSYTQAHNVLCNGDGHCCLGVGSDLMRKEAKKGTWGKELVSQDGSEVGLPFIIAGESSVTELPEAVRRWYGFTTAFGSFQNGKGEDLSLAELNDSEGKSFKYIARIIEQEPKGLFEI